MRFTSTAYRWFCRLGLEGAVPDHSTFSKNRHGRFRQSDLFRRVFENVLRRCIDERLVVGEGVAVDASLIKADANRQKGIEGDRDFRRGLPAEQSMSIWLSSMIAAFGAATEVEVRIALRAGGALDGGARRPSVFRLFRRTT